MPLFGVVESDYYYKQHHKRKAEYKICNRLFIHSFLFGNIYALYFFLQLQEAKKIITIPMTAKTVKPIVATIDISIAMPSLPISDRVGHGINSFFY
jgi:hypothetical protein